MASVASSGGAGFVSIVVPVYNEKSSLNELMGRLAKVLGAAAMAHEIIFVDDGSRDGSADLLREFASANDNVRVITFCRNFGQHAAVMAGFRAAKGDVIVTLDSDLQNPPEEIPKLLSKIDEGYEVVSGRREGRRDSLYRKAGSFMMNIIISRLTGVKLNDYGCMLRAYRKQVIGYLLQYGEKSVYIPAFTSWISASTAEVYVSHEHRKHGKSKYSMMRFLRQAFDLITAYTLMPIQLISIVGAVCAVAGLLLACYLI